MRGLCVGVQKGLLKEMEDACKASGTPSISEFCRLAVFSYYQKMCKGYPLSNYVYLNIKYDGQLKNNSINFALEDEWYYKIHNYCKSKGHSKSAFVREAVAFYITELDELEGTGDYDGYLFINFMDALYKTNVTMKAGRFNKDKLVDIRRGIKNASMLSKQERDILNKYVTMLIRICEGGENSECA